MYLPRVLVVEPDPSLRNSLCGLLSTEGYPYFDTDDPQEGLREIQQRGFDVLFIDPTVGNSEGLAVMETVRARFPSLEIIALAREPSVQITTRALRLGTYDILSKPFEDLGHLRQVLRRVSERVRLSRQNQVLLRELQAGNQGLARLQAALKELTNELLLLYTGAKARSATLDQRAVHELGVAALSTFCGGRETMFLRYDERDRSLRGEVTTNPDRRLLGRLAIDLGPDDPPRFDHIDRRHPVATLLCDYLANRNLIVLPLSYGGTPQGLLVVLDLGEAPLAPAEVKLVEQFAEWLELFFESSQLYQALLELSATDGLTGLYTHRFFQDRLREEVARSTRHGHPVSLLFCDLDNFKQYNDRYGHAAGDAVLVQMGRLLGSPTEDSALVLAFRESDIAARYGGEEFVVILPETPLSGAVTKAERLRAAVEHATFDLPDAEAGRITVSVGVAECPADAENRSELLERADANLYRAKQLGKNRVVSSLDRGARSTPRLDTSAAEDR